jgi:hypothetical protein
MGRRAMPSATRGRMGTRWMVNRAMRRLLTASWAMRMLLTPLDGDRPDSDATDSDAPDLDAPDSDAPDLDAPDLDAPDLDAPDLAPPARCGDGLVTGNEGCDDGEGNSDDAPDACRSDCQPARCGDDVIDTDEGCDDGAGNSDEIPDACRSDCQPARCGDGIVDADEGCDGDRTCDPASCQPACVDDCALAALGCEGDATIRCGDFDGDACYEWGDLLACGVDEACLDGACVCVDVCAADETRCGGAGVERCVAQGDGCLAWQADAVCDALQRCEAGACVRVPLVINEVYYDAVGADTPRVFTELWGPPGTVLDGLTLVGVNGNGGAVYGNVPLVGAIGADGFFVVAHPDAEPGLRGVADLFNRAVDWQNGPDSVQLRRGVEVLDAVGYGDFADAVFAGEGNPAPDVAEVSLTRDARHTDTDDNFADFTAGPPTPRGNPAPVCEEVCAADALRCAGDVSERCGLVDECLGWVVVDDCAAAGQSCVEGVCVEVCEDRCVADALRCVGEVSERCVTVDGCLDWAAEDDCAAVGEVCSAEGCVGGRGAAVIG